MAGAAIMRMWGTEVQLMRAVFRGVLPGGAVLLAAVATVVLLEDPTLDLVTDRYGIVLYGAGSILAGVFHRSRVVAVLAVFACVDFLAVAIEVGPDPFVSVATLLMGLLALFALLRDRGIASRGGIAQLSCGALVAYLAYLAFDDPSLVAGFETVQLLPAGMRAPGGLPQATAVVGVASIAAAAYGVYRWRGPVERALLWTQLLLLVAVYPGVGRPEASLLMMAAGLVLAIAVLETSYFMAYRDELTGLPARRALVHDLEQITGTYTLAMVDVDHFKKFNDKHGHDVGDQVLQLVASRLAAGPGGGKAYRYGGEEFTLMYPGRVRDDALPHADAVRQGVEGAAFALRAWNRPRKKPDGSNAKKERKPRKLSVTVSIGLADSTGKATEPEDALKKADKALYRAKRDGRNRVAK